MRFNKLQDWLCWQESCHPQEIELGLERVSQVADRLDLDFGSAKIITVAGTNGKGSCVALLDRLLTASGYTTATYTSPHLLAYNERICIAGRPVTDQQIMSAFESVDRARQGISLTYFEFGTLAALYIFKQQVLDVIILEVGLGGRLDAVNIIDADIAIISSIAIDHEDWLGSDREKIGLEKAGIIRQGKPVICGDTNPPASIKLAARQSAATLYQRDQQFGISSLTDDGWSWYGSAPDGIDRVLQALPRPLLSIDNVATVLQTLQLLELPINEGVYAGLGSISLPGRFQQLDYRGKRLILDVAHNIAAAQNLASLIREKKYSGRIDVLFGLMKDKDCAGFVSVLAPLVKNWHVVELAGLSRAMPAEQIAAQIGGVAQSPVNVHPDMRRGFTAAFAEMTASGEDVLLVTGSFYMVSELMRMINSGEIDEQ